MARKKTNNTVKANFTLTSEVNQLVDVLAKDLKMNRSETVCEAVRGLAERRQLEKEAGQRLVQKYLKGEKR